MNDDSYSLYAKGDPNEYLLFPSGVPLKHSPMPIPNAIQQVFQSKRSRFGLDLRSAQV